MNVLKRELRGNMKSLIIWSICMVLLVLVGMVKFSGISAAGSASVELFNSLPESVKAIFGLTGIDVTSVGGFFSMFFLYFMLLGSIHSGMLGATIISKEERDKTADYLFAKPRTRATIIAEKYAAWFINIIVFNLVTCVSSVVIVGGYNKGESITSGIIEMMTALFILQFLFGAIGLSVSSLVDSNKKATGITTAIILGTYMLSIGMSVNENLAKLRVLSPFKYFEGPAMMTGNGMEAAYVAFSIILGIGLSIVTFYYYGKRDLKV